MITSNSTMPVASKNKAEFIRRMFPWLGVLLLILAGYIAYSNCFAGVFLLDDSAQIVDNDFIRSLTPYSKFVFQGGLRKLPVMSFAANYAIGGLNPVGYHQFNLTIHILAGLALYAFLRSTFRQPKCNPWLAQHRETLAIAAAILWIVHPLNTQAVTYIVQRSESMMGLAFFTFLWLYAQSAISRRPSVWLILAWLAYCLGMVCKEVMLMCLPVALLYDRTFLSSDCMEIWQKRKWFWMACLAPFLFGIVIVMPMIFGSQSAIGMQLSSVSPEQYLRTQPEVIMHYMRLVFVPYPLIFDHGWPIENRWWVIALTSGFLIAIVGVLVIYYRRNPQFAFWGLAALIVLLPTSSLLPIQDLAVEHRMYVPLALVLIPLVASLVWLGKSFFRHQPTIVTSSVVFLITAAFAMMTYERNRDYHSPVRMWSDVIRKTSQQKTGNMLLGRAYSNLGDAYGDAKEWEKSIEMLSKALEYRQFPTQVHANLARAYIARNLPEKAVPHYQQAIQLTPDSARIRQLAGLVELMRGDLASAEAHFREALKLDAKDVTVLVNLGICLANQQKHAEAEQCFQDAIEKDQRFASGRQRLIELLLRMKRSEDALVQAKAYYQLDERDPIANYQLGLALAANNQLDEAVAHWKTAADSPTPPAEVNLVLGNAFRSIGNQADAKRYFEAELKINPDNADALNRMAEMCASDNPQLAVRYFQRVVQLAPRYWQARYNLASLHSMLGQKSAALEQIDRVLDLQPGFEPALKLREQIKN